MASPMGAVSVTLQASASPSVDQLNSTLTRHDAQSRKVSRSPLLSLEASVARYGVVIRRFRTRIREGFTGI